MPTATYQRLPEEKRNRIFQAAVDEFAEHRFSEASINRVVKASGISRGSFYQYFRDKEDLYLMVLEAISREKMSVFAACPAPSGDSTFFEAVVASTPAVLDWVRRCPKYNRIGMLLTQDGSEFTQRMVERMSGAQNTALELLRRDQERGLIREDVDLGLAVPMVMSVVSSLLTEYYADGERGQAAALDRIRQVFDILGNGIVRKEKTP